MSSQDDIKKKLRICVAQRGWVTKKAAKLAGVLALDPPPSQIVLEDAIDAFDQQLASLDEVQEEVELLLDSDEALLADIDEASKFRDSAREQRILAAVRLSAMIQAASPSPATLPPAGNMAGSAWGGTQGGVTSRTHAKLPKIDLVKFGGKLLEWLSFWQQFLALVDSDETLDDIVKFTHLSNCLIGEAKSVVAGMALTSANYKLAKELLKDRYGKEQRLKAAHINNLLNLKVCSNSYVELWRFYNQVTCDVRQLEALEVTTDSEVK